MASEQISGEILELSFSISEYSQDYSLNEKTFTDRNCSVLHQDDVRQCRASAPIVEHYMSLLAFRPKLSKSLETLLVI